MTDPVPPTYRVLTPPGAAAVAVIEVAGAAWPVVGPLFRPASGKPITPTVGRFHFGRFGPETGDEVLVAFTPRGVEVQCHGGATVVAWVVAQLTAAGCVEDATAHDDAESLLPFAVTAKTAAILLDQQAGAFANAVNDVRASLAAGDAEKSLERLDAVLKYGAIGRHLTAPFRVAVAGPPNVGKSSLVNALAGFQRAVVSDQPGTTRDVVAVAVAFAGWPVELLDTAGLRAGADAIEEQGVALAEAAHAAADLRLWVLDSSAPSPVLPPPSAVPTLIAANKADLPAGSALNADWHAVSAATGAGVPGLIAAVVRVLTGGESPPAGAAVPFTAGRIAALDAARAAVRAGNLAAAGAALPIH